MQAEENMKISTSVSELVDSQSLQSSVNQAKTFCPKKSKENIIYPKKNASKPRNVANSSRPAKSLRPSTRTVSPQRSRFKAVNTMVGPFSLRPARSVSSISEESNPDQAQTILDDRNEAEIIDDYLTSTTRRGSLPIVLIRKPASGFPFSGAVFMKSHIPTQFRRSSTSESVDRELQSLYKNHVEDKLLQQKFIKLDQQSFAGTLDYRSKRNLIFKEHQKLIQRTPSASEWLSLQKTSKKTNQKKEYPSSRPYKDQIKYFHNEVHTFRQHLPDSNKEIVRKMESKIAARRHTFSGDVLAESFSQFNKSCNTAMNYLRPTQRISMLYTEVSKKAKLKQAETDKEDNGYQEQNGESADNLNEESNECR